jgi:hypothetical protein
MTPEVVAMRDGGSRQDILIPALFASRVPAIENSFGEPQTGGEAGACVPAEGHADGPQGGDQPHSFAGRRGGEVRQGLIVAFGEAEYRRITPSYVWARVL